MNFIEALADEYAEQYVDRFKKVAKKAYKDGIMAIMKSYLEQD